MNVSVGTTELIPTVVVKQVSVFGLVMFLCIAIVLLPIGIVGNLLVIIVVKRKRYLHTKTNFLLANLAAFDLMANVLAYAGAAIRVFPMPSITFGKFLCRSNSYYPAATLCSILTLTIIALERYNAIVKPLSNGLKFEKRTLGYFIVAIWILSLTLVTPLAYYDDFTSEHQCTRTWSSTARFTYWTCVIICGIVLPLMVIIFCYFRIIRSLYFGRQIVPMNIPAEVDAREKKKVIKLSIIVTSVFILSFIPFAVVRELEIRRPVPGVVSEITLSFVLLSSVLNPFIYAYQSTNYRQAFKESITSC